MCFGNGFGGGNCCWIILILILLFCCCGGGNQGCYDNNCGCASDCGCC